MGDIKLRAWDVDVMRFFDITNKDGYRVLTSASYTYMQFTGLKDKNGKDIYEGDIVAYCGKEFETLIVRFGYHDRHGRYSNTVPSDD